jgi:hypothetical protein
MDICFLLHWLKISNKIMLQLHIELELARMGLMTYILIMLMKNKEKDFSSPFLGYMVLQQWKE